MNPAVAQLFVLHTQAYIFSNFRIDRKGYLKN